MSFYNKFYSNWGKPPAWLVPQIRYPEAILGSVLFNIQGQLDIDFQYHVKDPYVWRSGSDFFERPPGTEVNYILLTEDNKVLFVGVQLVEYSSSAGKNLATPPPWRDSSPPPGTGGGRQAVPAAR